MRQFLENKFYDTYDVTIGVDFGSKNLCINGKNIKALIWDTAGQEAFRSLTQSYYKNVAGALVVFDITNRLSFTKLRIWIKDMNSLRENEISYIIVGNKGDLKEKRTVSVQEAMDFAKSLNSEYIECSAKLSENVDLLFYRLSSIVLDRLQKNNDKIPGVRVLDAPGEVVVTNENTKPKNCC